MFVSAGLGTILASACVQVKTTVFGYLWGILEGSLMHLFQVICIAIATSARQGHYLIFGCSILPMGMRLFLAGCLLYYMSSGFSCLEQQFLNGASRSQSLVNRQWGGTGRKKTKSPGVGRAPGLGAGTEELSALFLCPWAVEAVGSHLLKCWG